MFFALMLTEYGFINVVATIPIIAAPTKNGRVDWYGERPALDIIMPSLDLVRLYEAKRVPINTASGKNNGTYSNNRTHDSYNAAIAVGLDGKRSTNVTAKIIPHTTSITRKKPLKKRRSKNLVKIFILNILCEL